MLARIPLPGLVIINSILTAISRLWPPLGVEFASVVFVFRRFAISSLIKLKIFELLCMLMFA